MVVVVVPAVAGALGSGRSSYASATVGPQPRSLIAPRQASGAAVALAEAEGHLHMSPQHQNQHQHPYPPAPHRSRASAHQDPNSMILYFCFYGRQECQSTQTRPGPFSTLSLRPEAIQPPNFESHTTAGFSDVHQKLDIRHFFLFHQKAVKLGAVQSATLRLLVLLPKVSLIAHFFLSQCSGG